MTDSTDALNNLFNLTSRSQEVPQYSLSRLLVASLTLVVLLFSNQVPLNTTDMVAVLVRDIAVIPLALYLTAGLKAYFNQAGLLFGRTILAGIGVAIVVHLAIVI